MFRASDFMVVFGDPRRAGDEVSYQVCVVTCDERRDAVAETRKTYRDVKRFLRSCERVSVMLGSVPRTPVLGALDPGFVEERRVAMEKALNCALEKHDELAHAGLGPELLKFLGVDTSRVPDEDVFVPAVDDTRTDLHGLMSLSVAPADSENFTAARSALRSSGFAIGKLLPRLGLSTSKSLAIVHDQRGLPYMLTVTRLGANAVSGLDRPERSSCVRRLLSTLDARYFLPVSDVFVSAGRMFVIRPFCEHGSLLDQMHGTWGAAVSTPIEEKLAKRSSPINLKRLGFLGFRALQVVAGCHRYGLVTPALWSLGNLMIGQDKNVVLTDNFEDMLAGTCRIPAVPQREDRTAVDLLLFGCVLLQASLGFVLDAESIASLLCCQGDPTDRRPDDERDPPPTVAIRALPGFDDLPESLLNLLFFIFHPSHPATLESVMNHPFFREARQAVLESALDDDASPVDEDGVPLFRFKKKDIALLLEAQAASDADLARRESLRVSRAMARSTLRAEGSNGTSSPRR